ncbi:hypothetical protein WICMUC_002035 [Wickerhamomyces mucosus]|uniref:AMP-dependent synthetase/ligase domain-containing protein n=1 Tax=Wickerhamomyces mucosus TaxID=1378264 RepID=A0A9P8PRZ7_9ASCO|nr:hypothetical protein WICMUC_002035 [Wickerhamomyces mucosus]
MSQKTVDDALNSIFTDYPIEKRYTSTPLSNSGETSEYSQIYRNAIVANSNDLVQTFHPELDTLSKWFQYTVRTFGKEDCLGYRRFNNKIPNQFDNFYTYESYDVVQSRKDNIASGILHLVTSHEKHTTKSNKPDFVVSILSPNRIEWLLLDLATRDYSLTNTALYSTLGYDSSKYILELTQSPIIFVVKENIPLILKLKEDGHLKELLIVVSLDEYDSIKENVARFKKTGVSFYTFPEVETLGEKNAFPTDFNPPTPETTYTISFTSGTTGNPKGVVLTHRNAVAGFTGITVGLGRPFSIRTTAARFSDNKDDKGRQITAICSLPLAHIYERQIVISSILNGFRVGLPSSNDPRLIFEDIKVLKPHFYCSVPRICNRVNSVISKFAHAHFGLKEGEFFADKGFAEAELLNVRNLFRSLFGFENLKFISSGSAPIDPLVIASFKDKFGVGFASGYGLTESFAGVLFGDFYSEESTGGFRLIGITTDVKVKDYLALGYSIKDEGFIRGELLLRGPQLFKEYYKNAKATEEAYDKDGWFATGDIVKLNRSTGEISIVDRVKNFFKLSQGEYITPERIENTYLVHNEETITSAFIHGDSLQSYLVGIISVSPENIINLLKIINVDYKLLSIEDQLKFLNKAESKRKLLLRLNGNVPKNQLNSFERLHNLSFKIDPFTIENDLLTPTLKFKRKKVTVFYADTFKELYGEGSLIKNEKL